MRVRWYVGSEVRVPLEKGEEEKIEKRIFFFAVLNRPASHFPAFDILAAAAGGQGEVDGEEEGKRERGEGRWARR